MCQALNSLTYTPCSLGPLITSNLQEEARDPESFPRDQAFPAHRVRDPLRTVGVTGLRAGDACECQAPAPAR